MLFWKCLTWPESELRTRSHISEPDWRQPSGPPSSHRMLAPRHHRRANGGGEDIRVSQLRKHMGFPTQAGQPTTWRPDGHVRSRLCWEAFVHRVRCNILFLECLLPPRQFYKVGDRFWVSLYSYLRQVLGLYSLHRLDEPLSQEA